MFRKIFSVLANLKRPVSFSVTDAMTVSITWSLPHYMIANGYHPLYRPFFKETRSHGVDCLAIDEPTAFDNLLRQPRLRQEIVECRRKAGGVKQSFGPAQICRDFFSDKNLALQHLFPGDIEFHHTCAFASGARPYVLHCESFLPVFFPMLKQGEGLTSAQELNLAAARDHYRAVFEHENCLLIVSHLEETLEQFREFFKSGIIARKLKYLRIGLDDRTVSALQSDSPDKGDPRRTFLFSSSAHQNPASFRIRGGVIALRLMRWFREHGRPARFVFRCAKPSPEDLERFGLSDLSLDPCPCVEVEWLTDYVSDEQILALFRQADFFLVPSANLHSVSIMQAMTAGCIPIATDTQGVNEFVENGRDGFVVAAKNLFWCQSPDTGIWFDDHAKFGEAENQIFDQVKGIICDVIDDTARLTVMSRAAQMKSNQLFRASKYTPEFWVAVKTAAGKVRRDKSPKSPFEACVRSVDDQIDFSGAIIPRLVSDSGSLRISRLRNLYWAFRGATWVPFNGFEHWSIFDDEVIRLGKAGDLMLTDDIEKHGANAIDA